MAAQVPRDCQRAIEATDAIPVKRSPTLGRYGGRLDDCNQGVFGGGVFGAALLSQRRRFRPSAGLKLFKPARFRPRSEAQERGFTFVEIMIVVAVIGLLGGIAIPNFVKARTTAQKNACIANLEQIDGAKEQWALENRKTQGASADARAVNSYLKNSAQPLCPADGTYTYQNVGVNPTCSIGAALGHTISLASRRPYLGRAGHARPGGGR